MTSYRYGGVLNNDKQLVPIHLLLPRDGAKPLITMKSCIFFDNTPVSELKTEDDAELLKYLYIIVDKFETIHKYDYARYVQRGKDTPPLKLDSYLNLEAEFTGHGVVVNKDEKSHAVSIAYETLVFTLMENHLKKFNLESFENIFPLQIIKFVVPKLCTIKFDGSVVWENIATTIDPIIDIEKLRSLRNSSDLSPEEKNIVETYLSTFGNNSSNNQSKPDLNGAIFTNNTGNSKANHNGKFLSNNELKQNMLNGGMNSSIYCKYNTKPTKANGMDFSKNKTEIISGGYYNEKIPPPPISPYNQYSVNKQYKNFPVNFESMQRSNNYIPKSTMNSRNYPPAKPFGDNYYHSKPPYEHGRSISLIENGVNKNSSNYAPGSNLQSNIEQLVRLNSQSHLNLPSTVNKFNGKSFDYRHQSLVSSNAQTTSPSHQYNPWSLSSSLPEIRANQQQQQQKSANHFNYSKVGNYVGNNGFSGTRVNSRNVYPSKPIQQPNSYISEHTLEKIALRLSTVESFVGDAGGSNSFNNLGHGASRNNVERILNEPIGHNRRQKPILSPKTSNDASLQPSIVSSNNLENLAIRLLNIDDHSHANNYKKEENVKKSSLSNDISLPDSTLANNVTRPFNANASDLNKKANGADLAKDVKNTQSKPTNEFRDSFIQSKILSSTDDKSEDLPLWY